LDRLLGEIQSESINVEIIEKQALPKEFRFRRGYGHIHGSLGFGGCEPLVYFGFGHPFNPLLWFADWRLLKSIELFLRSNGSAIVNLKDIEKHEQQPVG
jgi:hypothetical protein